MRRLALVLCTLLLLGGCAAAENPSEGSLKEWAVGKTRDALGSVTGKLGEGVMSVLDSLRNAEYEGGPFENNLESARAYLLAQLEEKYGVAFTVVGRESLVNYGAFAGASYSCEAAPVDAPERVTSALVSQSLYQNVRDDYAVWFFREEAETPFLALCEEKAYILDARARLEMPETQRRWTPEDGAETFFAQSGAAVRLDVRFADGLDAQTCAEYLSDFLHSLDGFGCDLLLQAQADGVCLFFRELPLREGFDADEFSVADLKEDVETGRQMGMPR